MTFTLHLPSSDCFFSFCGNWSLTLSLFFFSPAAFCCSRVICCVPVHLLWNISCLPSSLIASLLSSRSTPPCGNSSLVKPPALARPGSAARHHHPSNPRVPFLPATMLQKKQICPLKYADLVLLFSAVEHTFGKWTGEDGNGPDKNYFCIHLLCQFKKWSLKRGRWTRHNWTVIEQPQCLSYCAFLIHLKENGTLIHT